MNQVRKTTFITLAFIFSVGLLSGCGISGPLYAPGTGDDAENAKSAPVATQTVENTENTVSNTADSEAE